MPEIKIEMLRKEFKEVVAVKDVSITFRTGMVTCLLGPSGCGKTTLMRMIAGLEKPTSGSIYFDDVNITGLPPEKRNIGMVFQYPVVYRGMNVYKNIDLPLVEEGLTEVERKNRIEEIVDILNLRDSLYLNVDQIDNSTRQRVAVARAVARRPQIILFDEPLTNVDVATKVQLKHALKKLTKFCQDPVAGRPQSFLVLTPQTARHSAMHAGKVFLPDALVQRPSEAGSVQFPAPQNQHRHNCIG